MCGGPKPDPPKQYEDDLKARFIEEPANIEAADRSQQACLTGFDAASARYIYLDKRTARPQPFPGHLPHQRLDGEEQGLRSQSFDFKELSATCKQRSPYSSTSGHR